MSKFTIGDQVVMLNFFGLVHQNRATGTVKGIRPSQNPQHRPGSIEVLVDEDGPGDPFQRHRETLWSHEAWWGRIEMLAAEVLAE